MSLGVPQKGKNRKHPLWPPAVQLLKNHFTMFLGVFTHTPPEGGENWDLEKQTLSTDQKSTVQTKPKKSKPHQQTRNLGKGYLA